VILITGQPQAKPNFNEGVLPTSEPNERLHPNGILPYSHSKAKFASDLDYLIYLTAKCIPFSFNRISDGELFMLMGRSYALGVNGDFGWRVEGRRYNTGQYPAEERKDFDKIRDNEFVLALRDAIALDLPNYFLGLPCPCCGSERSEVSSLIKILPERRRATFANLLINSNYPRFIEELVPHFNKYTVILVANKRVKTDSLTFNVSHFLPVEDNSHTRYKLYLHELHLLIREVLNAKPTKPLLLLTSAGAAAKVLVAETYRQFPNRITCIEVGSTLSPYMGLNGWKHSREYLKEYFLAQPKNYLNRTCSI
jgi:hypothetical protein